ncbi:DUF1720 domain-containing protein [Flavobacterium alkalisoli]|uniref:DUF1720 domain-containing protein n=1 Tax=Flavobacterium alkalisoli TaxID=2602769 RepID=UPI003A8F9F43
MKDISELNNLYTKCDANDKNTFVIQRSNLNLFAGNHYPNKAITQRAIGRTKNLSATNKVRLTRNHIGIACKDIINSITDGNPDVVFEAKNDCEAQDRKASELSNSVWSDIKDREKFKRKKNSLAQDFVVVAEAYAKVGFDVNKGKYIPSQPMTNEFGEALYDPETYEPVMTEARWSGQIFIEQLEPYNLLWDSSAKNWEGCKYIIYRKLMDTKDLKKMVGDNIELLKFIEEANEDTYVVQDSHSGAYEHNIKGKTMVREYYFKPCAEYPNGYYYIATPLGVLYEGELPAGIFPIAFVGFNESGAERRPTGPIKDGKPYQGEVNRLASRMAEISMTYKEKLLVHSSSKLTNGGTISKVNAIKYSGVKPEIMKGETGEWLLPTLNDNINGLYKAMMVEQHVQDEGSQLDPYQLLHRSLKDKKRFSIYTDKFEDFLCDIATIAVTYAKTFYTDDHIIPAIGKKEIINIEEFKNTDELLYQVKCEPLSADVSTQLGKQLALTQTLQYASSQLDPQQIGLILKDMPFVSNEALVKTLTRDITDAENVMLALERSEYLPIMPSDNHSYMEQALTSRMREASFKYLSPEVQQLYQRRVSEHQNVSADLIRKQKQLEQSFIPSGGALIGCDLKVTHFTKSGDPVPKRMTLPSEAVEWLYQVLEKQGSLQQQLTETYNGYEGNLGNVIDQALTQQPTGMGQQLMPSMMPQLPNNMSQPAQ